MADNILNEFTNKTGIAIIGFGGMGGWHCKKIRAIEALSLRGVYDIRKERCDAAEELGVHAYESLEALLADPTVEIVTVAIPNHLHRDMCIRVMEAGKHVVCEKPVTLSSQDLQAMIDASKKNGVLFTVHQNRRWDGDFRTVRYMYDQHTLGRVFRIESRVHGSRGIPGDWRNRKEYGGGMVMDWGVHLLDQILHMIDKPLLSIYATLSYVTNENCDDGFTVTLQFEGNLTVVVEVGTSNFISMPRWYMLGENGSAIIHNFAQEGKIVMVSDWEKRDAVPVVTAAGLTKTMAPRREDTIKTLDIPDIWPDLGEYYRNITACLEGRETPIVIPAQMLRVMRLVDTVFEAARVGQVLPFED